MSNKDNLTSFTLADVQEHSSAGSCYVTIKDTVYDVTEFMEDHPGGDDLILDYAGKDVAAIMEDEDSHFHSAAAFSILEEYRVGYLVTDSGKSRNAPTISSGVDIKSENPSDAQTRQVFATTGLSCAEDLSKDTDTTKDYQIHKFLDLGKPLLPQVWMGGFSKEFYLDQVHRPRHYRGGASAPLFGNFLEPLTKTPWWVIPIVWIPCVTYGVYLASEGLTTLALGASFTAGLGLWTLIEYVMHRFVFHLDDYLPDNRVALTAHFLLHGVHHYLPMDRYRLVMPPTLFVALASPFWALVRAIFGSHWHMGTAVYCGGILGYIGYDLTHYFLHHKQLPAYYQDLKKYHMEHHFADYENGFGVTSRFWDVIFGTQLATSSLRTAASST